VIAEARRRQHRRRLIVLGIACCVALATITFVVIGHRTAGQPRVVRVYFAAGATPAQILRTVTAVKAEHGVSAVGIVTKEAALADLKRRFPNLVAGSSYNPLPDSIQIRVSRAAAAGVIADLRQARLAPITAIQQTPVKG
jgi:cell division protein FtsX